MAKKTTTGVGDVTESAEFSDAAAATGEAPDSAFLVRLSAEISAAYATGNRLSADDMTALIHTAFSGLAGVAWGRSAIDLSLAPKPAVPVRRSVTPDTIICLEDGKRLKMLKRHLRTAFNLSPEEYRAKWGLPHDYPMVAPNYAKQRSDFAKKIGLGRSGRRPAN